jgi:hypothetical protein
MPTCKDFEAIIVLNDGKTQVRMQVELRHEEEACLGFICLYIDIDSMTICTVLWN